MLPFGAPGVLEKPLTPWPRAVNVVPRQPAPAMSSTVATPVPCDPKSDVISSDPLTASVTPAKKPSRPLGEPTTLTAKLYALVRERSGLIMIRCSRRLVRLG